MSKRISLIIIIALGLILRLLAWRWHEFYALGGDEREYLAQAIRLVRDHQYGELRLMRPPLYPLFLAGCIYLVDSLVQNLRLVQALISAATVPLVYLLTREVTWRSDRRTPALLAALLCALSYTLAANASELLTEALFLFGLTTALWLLLRAARTQGLAETILAGLIIGALCLLRSVALPLLPLGALWLLFREGFALPKNRFRANRTPSPPAPLPPGERGDSASERVQLPLSRNGRGGWGVRAKRMGLILPLAFALATLLVVLPWTVRNYTTYGGLILIDTTGAENLWLDNDPAGRESVKAQLYALSDDRLARQRLATQQGLAVISADPARFAAKAWGELKKLFALEFSDDLLARPAIWVSPPEVAARLLLGDGVWLLMLLAGGWGLARGSGVGGRGSGVANTERGDENTNQNDTSLPPATYHLPPATWLVLPWALYVALTTLIFHVELRYRLPLYPALLPYAGLVLAGVGSGVRGQGSGVRGRVLAAIVPDSHAIRAQHPMKRAANTWLSAITTVVTIFAERLPPITPPSPPASGGEPMHCSPPACGGVRGGDPNCNCRTIGYRLSAIGYRLSAIGYRLCSR
ncbi:MAG: glycosyltransferase family 39 protein [Chloroflexales bacterium]